MNVRLEEIAKHLGLKNLTAELVAERSREVSSGHASDLLSDVLANAPQGSLLVTIQVHMNVIAVASHAGLAGVIFAAGRTPEKVQELIYELPIERVMKKDVITVSPDTSMIELKEVLRVNRISGVPVLEEERLVGIISIEDLIKALENGDIQAPVREKMTTRPITVRENESVVEAVKKFAQYKVGRLLVVNHQGDLVGILTGGDITRGLLEAISLNYHVEEISRYRARHIFEDIISDKTSLILRYKVKPKGFKSGGRASSRLKRALDRLGAHPEDIRRVAISAYEAEMNLVIHADNGGELVAEIEPEMIHISVIDQGPGIPDIEKAMSLGFSTAPNWIRELGFGAGMGLSNIKRCSDSVELESEVGVGTKLGIVIYLRQELSEESTQTRKSNGGPPA